MRITSQKINKTSTHTISMLHEQRERERKKRRKIKKRKEGGGNERKEYVSQASNI